MTPGQTTLDEAVEARDEAIRAVAASEAPFVAVAFQALQRIVRMVLAGTYPWTEITSEHVWVEYDLLGYSRPAEGRAMGPVMQRGIREGLIRPVGYRQSTDPKHHADVMRVYEVVR